MIFHEDTHLPIEGSSPTNRPLGVTFPKAFLTPAYSIQQNIYSTSSWIIVCIGRHLMAEECHSATHSCAPPPIRARKIRCLSTASPHTHFQPDPLSVLQVDRLFTLRLKFPEIKDLLKECNPCKYLQFISRAKAITDRSSILQHHTPGFHTLFVRAFC